MDKDGKSIGLLIGLGKPKRDEGDDDDGEDTSAAQAVLDAIKADDANALKEALELCYEQHRQKGKEEQEY